MFSKHTSISKSWSAANKGFIEPQGLLVDTYDNIFLSDEYADIIVEYQPI